VSCLKEKALFKPFRKYKLDYNRLKRWYLGSLYSYELAVSTLSEAVPKDKRLEEIYYDEKHLIEVNHYNLIKKYNKGYVKFLEEMVVIRIISLLENTLLEIVEAIFYYDKTKFYIPKKVVEFQVSEFLSKNIEELHNKYVKDIIGNLHRQGFKEISKFFNKNFDINFNNYRTNIESQDYGIKYVYKIHDIRHLLVHRLGKTDEKFQTEYNYKGRRIEMTEKEVILYLEIINNFVLFIEGQIEKWR